MSEQDETQDEPTPEPEETEAKGSEEKGDEKAKGKARPLYYNIVSHLGGLVVVLGAVLIAISLLAHVTSSGGINPYMGIFTFMVFPALMFAGIVMFLLGMRWEAGRRRRAEDMLETVGLSRRYVDRYPHEFSEIGRAS